jgi:hypothetical protein
MLTTGILIGIIIGFTSGFLLCSWIDSREHRKSAQRMKEGFEILRALDRARERTS